MTKPFETFAAAVAHVRERGRVGYQAPLDHSSNSLPAKVTTDGRIKLEFYVPADSEWPSETFYRYATGLGGSLDHFDRLRSNA